MSLIGMDPDAVRQLSAQFTNSAGEIRQLVSTLTTQIQNVNWLGSDHDQFISDWSSQHTVQLNRVADALDEAATRALNNAIQQEQTSAV